MCRWKCSANDTTYMCKWCGTRFCKVCLVGDFPNKMKSEDHCAVCNQPKCLGKRVEYVPPKKTGTTKSRNEKRTRKVGKKNVKKGTKGKKKSKKKR